MYSLVSNCKGGLNCVFGKFHHPFCCITAHGIAGAKLVSNWERNMSYTKSSQILHRKGYPYQHAWKCHFWHVSRYLFYRAEYNVKGDPDAIEFWSSWNVKMKYTNGQIDG